jgi:hypothetical protein
MTKFKGRLNIYYQDGDTVVHLLNEKGKSRLKIPLAQFREVVKMVEAKVTRSKEEQK